MKNVTALIFSEAVSVDGEQLASLYRQMGSPSAEDVVCRAIEELAVRLSHCDRVWRAQNLSELRKSVRALIAIAEQVGMTALAQVARDVVGTIDTRDPAAIAATLFRLIRIGERSVTAVSDQQDLSV